MKKRKISYPVNGKAIWSVGEERREVDVISTKNSVTIYWLGKQIACARCQRERDFNFDGLFEIAKQISGTSFEWVI